MSAPLLEVRDLSKKFGGIKAIDSLNFSVDEGQIVGIIGPNGAGKTTVFNLITGFYPPSSGSMVFKGASLAKLSPDRIVRLGIARTFQNIRLFNNLSCLENVLIPLLQNATYGLAPALFRFKGAAATDFSLRQQAFAFLEEVGLSFYAEAQASTLPYGLQRKLEMARALAGNPSLLLLDEPAAGMNPEECRELSQLIRSVKEKHQLTVLIIEHHMDVILSLCSDVIVMRFGSLLARGTPAEVCQDERVRSAYLGRGGSHALRE